MLWIISVRVVLNNSLQLLYLRTFNTCLYKFMIYFLVTSLLQEW